jgi:hypothetical protein
LAQGAAMAIEDAAVLSGCLEGVEPQGVAAALAEIRGDTDGAALAHAAHVAPERLGQGRNGN